MKENLGVINPNLLEQEPNMLAALLAAITGIFMALIVSGIIAFIMSATFNTRINIASFIAANTLSSIFSIIFIVVLAVYSTEIWIISSVMVWCSTYMICLYLLQPPSLEQLLVRTHKDVLKLEKQAEKIDKKAKAKQPDTSQKLSSSEVDN